MNDPIDTATETALARLITSGLTGCRWRDLTPLDVAKHLAANGVTIHDGASR